ncbi:hypothetical protein CCACVL1_29540 [Corchorus capsularis]|uniref:DNA damage-binding protein 1 n=1 Tax=Corchorus capsularis TaxID=210143 RepID=A0A1R3G195_COCAP|nr:hypothetical protein CCACVL1_29540 [Corchorus capsularis]
MVLSEEECSTAKASSSSSSSSSSAAGSSSQGVNYLAKCVLRGSVVLQVAYGHLRSPSSSDVVFGKETSIELVIIGEDGIATSVCEQTVFGTIKDLAILPWNEKLGAQNSQMHGKDLLIVASDSGKLAFLSFCNEMHRFFPVANVQLSDPGNSRHQLGKMLAVDSTGSFIATSAHEDRLALFSLSMSAEGDIIDEKIFYPPENEGSGSSTRSVQRTSIRGTIWSMCFVSKDSVQPHEENNPVVAVVLTRKGNTLNELVLLRWNIRERAVYVLSQYLEAGPLAHSIVEVPHSCGFAFLLRAGDALLMDLRDAHNPHCVYRTNLNFSAHTLEEQNFAEESSRAHDVDDEGLFNVAACALLQLSDYDPMCIDGDSGNCKLDCKYVCSFSWETKSDRSMRMIFCLDTGEFFMFDISFDSGSPKVNISDCLYRSQPCKSLLWVDGGFLVAIVEMGDGMVLKVENERLICTSPIQNIAPILDMSIVDYHGEKRDQMFACCGVAPEGSLRIIRSGISVEKLLRTDSIYEGITGTWTVRMKVKDSYHSFLVLSFVEETRVLSVGLSFTDITDSVGFQPNVCTLSCGLVGDGQLVQIHRNAIRLCLPTNAAHSEGIPLSSPVCTSWSPNNTSISLGAVGQDLIVVSTSNPYFLYVLGVRSLSAYHYEIYELQHVRLQYELSCISIPQRHFELRHSGTPLSPVDNIRTTVLPVGVGMGITFVIGTHRPSVEVLSFTPQGLRVLGTGTISLTNTMETAVSGCIPQDVRLVLVDQFYVLSGLRNGMLLRFEWPSAFAASSSESKILLNTKTAILFGSEMCAFNVSGKDDLPVNLQLIATRRIGVTPVFLVPLGDSFDADIIALSDRPWLLHTARHSLSYTSISFQPSTHATPVCSAECPKGILFVAENCLHLVEMVHSKRLNVQKFHLGGTPRKVLYHSESKLLVVMRTELSNDTSSSDICCVDPISGSVVASFNLDPGETGKCMELVRAGNEQVLVVGTSQSPGPAIMPSGEAESTKGRLIVLRIEQVQNSDSGSITLFSTAGSSSQRNSPFREMFCHATEQLSSSSICSSPDDISYEGIKVEETEVWRLRSTYSNNWPGMVLAICPYLDHYFLVSAGNSFYVCAFPSDNPQRVRRYAIARTRFMITSLTANFTRIAVGDCRDGILFYSFHEETKKLEQTFCDPSQRLVADCVLTDVDTAVVSDRKGSIAVLSCSDRAQDNASPERNLTLTCAYYMGEIAMSIKKGSFIYKLPADDMLNSCEGLTTSVDPSHSTIMASTLLGSIMIFIPISREEYELLEAVQARLIVHPLTAPVLGNDHNEYRSRENQVGVPKILDGDMLAQFLELTSLQQEAVLSSPISSPDTHKLSPKPPAPPIPVNKVVQLLERIHYALN